MVKIRTQPKYILVAEEIKKLVTKKGLEPGDMIPSEEQLKRSFNVSRQTVREGISRLVQEGQLLKKQGKGTFVEEPKREEINIQIICDPSFSLRESNPLGWFISFYVLQGIVDGCARFKCKPNFVDPHSEDFASNKFQAVIAMQSSPKIIENLGKTGHTVVIPYGAPPELKCSKVIVDREEAAYKGVTHLLNLGHQRIAYLGAVYWNSEICPRCRGYRKALKERGFLLEEYIRDCSNKEEDIYKSTTLLLNLQERPTAIFVSADLMALRAMKLIKEKGLRIPEDIAIVSYDDIPEASTCNPPLTTLHPPRYECGYESVRLLWQLIHKEKKEPEMIILPTKLIIRKSCGAYLKEK